MTDTGPAGSGGAGPVEDLERLLTAYRDEEIDDDSAAQPGPADPLLAPLGAHPPGGPEQGPHGRESEESASEGPGAEGAGAEGAGAEGAGAEGAGTEGADQDDAGPVLPEAPLFALLRTVETEVGVERIDRIWVFPPRRLEVGETSVVVVAAYAEREEQRRRVYAAHYTVPAEAREARLDVDEYGTAPTERVGRLVEEVVERIKEGPAAAPVAHRVEGDGVRWHQVLHDLAEAYLAEAERNPRLRR